MILQNRIQMTHDCVKIFWKFIEIWLKMGINIPKLLIIVTAKPFQMSLKIKCQKTSTHLLTNRDLIFIRSFILQECQIWDHLNFGKKPSKKMHCYMSRISLVLIFYSLFVVYIIHQISVRIALCINLLKSYLFKILTMNKSNQLTVKTGKLT